MANSTIFPLSRRCNSCEGGRIGSSIMSLHNILSNNNTENLQAQTQQRRQQRAQQRAQAQQAHQANGLITKNRSPNSLLKKTC